MLNCGIKVKKKLALVLHSTKSDYMIYNQLFCVVVI